MLRLAFGKVGIRRAFPMVGRGFVPTVGRRQQGMGRMLCSGPQPQSTSNKLWYVEWLPLPVYGFVYFSTEIWIAVLRHGTQDMKTKAAEKLCDKGCYTIQGRDRFTYGTGPSPIKARLRDGTYGTLMEKADAVNSLFVLYMHSDERVAGGIEPLKALLRDGTLMGKAHAAIALLMLSPEREADAGVEAVVALLRDGPPEVRVAAAKALRYFCVNADARVEIVAAGGVEALTALLRDGSPAGKWMAARALERLTQTPETR